MKERRGARRRSLPFVRSGVLELNGRNHIVAVTDLSPEAAFLVTRVAAKPDDSLRLKMVLPRDGREVVIPCRIARRSSRPDPRAGRPGLAVRFHGLDASTVRRLEEFTLEGFLPSLDPVPIEHFEYRIVEPPTLTEADLNRLGLDGWLLASTVSEGSGLRLIFVRRL